MSNHTPGPWEIEYDDLTEEWIVLWETGSAEVGGLHAADQARLIATAPELLEALNDLLIASSPMAKEPQSISKAVKKALSAIAKAKGET